MVEKQAKMPTPKKKVPASKRDQGKPGDGAAGSSAKAGDVDRPGLDLGGSTGKTTAGTGLGLGVDAAENRHDRRLPRGGGKRE
jgi:hypothetical protein